MNWDSVIGACIGTGITGAVAIIGQYLSRRTTLDTTQIDDRSKFQQNLMAQLDAVEKKAEADRREHRLELDEIKRVVRLMQRREFSFLRLLTTVEAELRILNMHMTLHQAELSEPKMDRTDLQKRVEEICQSISRIQGAVEKEGEHLLMDVEHRGDSLPENGRNRDSEKK